MRKTLKKYFIPHESNQYKPHILRERSIFVLSLIAIVLFLTFTFEGLFISSFKNIAAIFPGVLTDDANDTRVSLDLVPLKMNSTLVAAAQLKANDMASKSYFAHTSPEGITPWYWFTQAGYNFMYAGENLAVDFSDSQDVHKAWLNSPGHRANIVNPNFTEIGIATAEGQYNGRRTVFVVELFGQPAPKFDLTPPLVASNETDIPSTPENVSGANATDRQVFNLIPIETITETDLFVAVKNPAVAEAMTPETVVVNSGQALGQTQYSSWFAEIISTPKRTLTFAYFILAAIILIALIFAVLIEVRRQHPKHILYAIALLILIIVLLYTARTLVLPSVAIL